MAAPIDHRRRPARSGDIPGLHCAIAEALLGPGRYFGVEEWNAFKDCLCGGFAVAPSFTLTWHDGEIAGDEYRPTGAVLE
ncbi:barstar family protein [Streptomyces sp. NPDC054849]